MQIAIGDTLFKSKAAAQDAIRAVRDRYVAGTNAADDEAFLIDLVALHPHAAEKIGAGIRGFDVRRNMGSTLGFWITRVDGSETDFSFVRCLNGVTQEEQVRIAMRLAVRDQVLAFKVAAFGKAEIVECPFTGERLTQATAHADHSDPLFVQIADTFAALMGGYDAIPVVAGDGKIGCTFVDPEQMAQWRRFHRERARLQIVSAKANLSILRRGITRNGAA